MKLRALLPLAAVLLGATATPATAAPDRTVTLSAAAPKAEWTGRDDTAVIYTSDVGDNLQCGDPNRPCEDTLLKLDSPGTLTLKTTNNNGSTGNDDVDIFLYESDSSGKKGKLIRSAAGPDTEETLVEEEMQPGVYLVQVEYYLTFQSGYKATADLLAAAPAGTDPGVAPAPAGNTPPNAVAFPVKGKGLKAFSGTASDSDGLISRVEVGVLKLSGKKCTQLTAKGTFAKAKKCAQPTTFLAAQGKESWKFTLKKKFGKGKYVLFVRAVDDKGATTTGFTPTSRRAFKVA